MNGHQPATPLSPKEKLGIAREREAALSRLLVAYISSGLVFLLLPGSFLGVWNLLKISAHEKAAFVSPAWLQAHGHAQVFGWVGSFILGIGFYSVPKLRGAARPSTGAAWACWAMWTVGVLTRWVANISLWHWRLLLPLSAVVELAAFLIFFRAVSQHRPEHPGRGRRAPWIWVVLSATLGLLVVLIVNLASCSSLALYGQSPARSPGLDQRYLILLTWGFLVPFVWGFSAKWMPLFLGLKPPRSTWLLAAIAVDFAGVALGLWGWESAAAVFFVAATACAIRALRMFERAVEEPKTRGVHSSFPFFVRTAYGWLLVAALLGVAARAWTSSGGLGGASRHALTVGFIAMMVLCVGQRVLPAFAGMRRLWSTRLMFAGLLLLALGCTLRVASEILAYGGYAGWAWSALPVSAFLELGGITVFAVNILGTLILGPRHAQKESLVVALAPGLDEARKA